MPKLPCVMIICGKRGSGKSTACGAILQHLPIDRLFWVGSTWRSNRELIKRLKVQPEDIYEDTDDLTVIDKIKAEVQKEAEDLERAEEELKRYNALMKVINSNSPLIGNTEELLAQFYGLNGEFQKPRHRWNFRKPCIGCVFDDCLGSMIYSKPRKLNALVTFSRHLGTFKDGRPAIGLNLWFLVQSIKAQTGGLTKVIRNNASQYMMFKSHSVKEQEDLAEAVSGEVPAWLFLQSDGYAIQDKHDLLFIDLNKKPTQPSMFRRNLNEYIIIDQSFSMEVSKT